MVVTLKKTGLPALLAAALLAACQPGGQLSERETAAAAEEAVMAHHDTLMVRTERLFEAREKLTAAAKTAAGAPAAQVPAALRSLQTAQRGMMSWMYQYHAPDSAAPAAQRLAYFQAQEKQLAAVERRLTGALDSANALLHQLQPAPVAQPEK